ncbi:MAG: toll/interleukin-1 receptor domain-containing protein [Anaerolineae bacterium]|nr:toll/interleukin-1 receptor domain-containing protein [Anaerolineae bacterium]
MNDLARLPDLLMPAAENVPARRSLLREALGARSPLLASIVYEGGSRAFVVGALVALAVDRTALDALLDVAKDRPDVDAAAVEALRSALHAWAESGAPRDVLEAPAPMPTSPIFLSYSRANRESARALYAELGSVGFTLWRDVHDIPPGDPNWWGTICDAIDGCSRMILCLSVDSLRSTVVSDEWNRAQRQGKQIIPVVVDEVFRHPAVLSGDLIVPKWLTTVNIPDLRPDAPERSTAFANLTAALRKPYTQRKISITTKAEQLPHNFVPRPREFEPLVTALTVEDHIGTVALTAALRGAGGYGKTTLAKALCRDWRISGAYPDGIYWTTLGEKLLTMSAEVREAELVDRLLDLVVTMTGVRPGVQKLDAAGVGGIKWKHGTGSAFPQQVQSGCDLCVWQSVNPIGSDHQGCALRP